MKRLVLLTPLFFSGCSTANVVGLVLDSTSLLAAPRPEGCEECVEAKRAADGLADAVPIWMAQSAKQAGPGATATRTGHFSWEVEAPGLPVSHCKANRGEWRCDPTPGTGYSPPL